MTQRRRATNRTQGVLLLLASWLGELLDRPVGRWLRSRAREPGLKQGHRVRQWPPVGGVTARPAI